MGKFPLFMLFLSVFLTCNLAIRYTNPDPQRDFLQCVQRCDDLQDHGTGGSKGQHDCRHQCQKWLSLLDDDNQGRQCEMVCEKRENEPWKCKQSCKDIELGDLELDENLDEKQGRECEMVCERHGSEPWKCKKRCKDIGLGEVELLEKQGRECEMRCERHGGEPWKCKKSCKDIELGGDLELDKLDDNQGRQCEIVCEKDGSEPWKCKKRCKDIDLGDKEIKHLAKCQQKCVGKDDNKCLRRCVQGSQSQRRGGSVIELVQLSR